MDIKKEEEPWGMDTPGKLCCAVSVQMSGIRTAVGKAAEAGVGSGLWRES